MSALAVLQALEHHITPRCQVTRAGPLSTHHSFGTEPDALDHGASLSLCSCSTTTRGISAAGSVGDILTSHM